MTEPTTTADQTAERRVWEATRLTGVVPVDQTQGGSSNTATEFAPSYKIS